MKVMSSILLTALVSSSAFAAGGSDIGSSSKTASSLSQLDCSGIGPGYLGENMVHRVVLKKGVLTISNYLDENNGSSVSFKKGMYSWKENGVTALGNPGALEVFLIDAHKATLKRAQYDQEGNKLSTSNYIELKCK